MIVIIIYKHIEMFYTVKMWYITEYNYYNITGKKPIFKSDTLW